MIPQERSKRFTSFSQEVQITVPLCGPVLFGRSLVTEEHFSEPPQHSADNGFGMHTVSPYVTAHRMHTHVLNRLFPDIHSTPLRFGPNILMT